MSTNKEKSPYFCGNNLNWPPEKHEIAETKEFPETTQKPTPDEREKIPGAGW